MVPGSPSWAENGIEAPDLPANSTWTCLDRSSLSRATGGGDGVHGIVWRGAPNLSEAHGDVGRDGDAGPAPFSYDAASTDVTIFVAVGAIARTRAICPGNIPYGMPRVCRGFVSASFRFLRQHGGLSVIYPNSPNTQPLSSRAGRVDLLPILSCLEELGDSESEDHEVVLRSLVMNQDARVPIILGRFDG